MTAGTCRTLHSAQSGIGGCHMFLTANSDYFCIQHKLAAVYNGDTSVFCKVQTNFLYVLYR